MTVVHYQTCGQLRSTAPETLNSEYLVQQAGYYLNDVHKNDIAQTPYPQLTKVKIK